MLTYDIMMKLKITKTDSLEEQFLSTVPIWAASLTLDETERGGKIEVSLIAQLDQYIAMAVKAVQCPEWPNVSHLCPICSCLQCQHALGLFTI